MNASSDLNQNDMDDLAAAQRESLAEDAALIAAAETPEATPEVIIPAAPAPAVPATPPAAVTPAAPEPAAPAAPAAAATPAAPEPAPAEAPKGDLRGALRASRHEAKRLREENERLRAGTPAPTAPKVTAVDDATLADLDQYAPAAAQALRESKVVIEQLSSQVSAAPAPAKVFTPEYLPDDVQEVVDELPDLLEWQTNEAHKAKWDAVKDADTLLSKSPVWGAKPFADRFKEAMRIVQVTHNTASPPPPPAPAAPTPAQAQAVIDALPMTNKPVTVGSMRSGESPENETLDFNQMVKEGATDEEIMARLG